MSFKREGDDSSQLNILKKRRVADLLSNFIPEDEAALMKNGRYTCLVCSYRPVFDTVDMLALHRQGKRHLEGLKWFYGKKERFQNEVEKHRHQEYIQAEDCRQVNSSFLFSPLLTETRKITHHVLLKSTPYSSCHKKTRYTKSDKASTSIAPPCKSPSWYQNSSGEATAGLSTETAALHQNTKIGIQQRQQLPEKRKKTGRGKAHHASTSEADSLTVERRRELEHYLKLKSSGWLQDSSGNWIKDENVEFDSDEDQPAPLLPSADNVVQEKC
ncbi:sodium channel modifier 1 [Arapaima gigas]